VDPVEDLSTPITVNVAARPDALHILRVVAASAAALLDLPFERVIVSHGEPVHDRNAFERALELPPFSDD